MFALKVIVMAGQNGSEVEISADFKLKSMQDEAAKLSRWGDYIFAEYQNALENHKVQTKHKQARDGVKPGDEIVEHEPEGGTLILTSNASIYEDRFGNSITENYKGKKLEGTTLSFGRSTSAKATKGRLEFNFEDGSQLTVLKDKTRGETDFARIGFDRYIKRPNSDWQPQDPL